VKVALGNFAAARKAAVGRAWSRSGSPVATEAVSMLAVTLEPARFFGSKRISASQRRKTPEKASLFMLLEKRTGEAALFTIQPGAGAARAAVVTAITARSIGRRFMSRAPSRRGSSAPPPRRGG